MRRDPVPQVQRPTIRRREMVASLKASNIAFFKSNEMSKATLLHKVSYNIAGFEVIFSVAGHQKKCGRRIVCSGIIS